MFSQCVTDLYSPPPSAWIRDETYISDPWPQSCVYNFLIRQRLLIRGDSGAECKLGFDKAFGSIIGYLIIYIHPIHSPSRLHFPTPSPCLLFMRITFKLNRSSFCVILSEHNLRRMSVTNQIISSQKMFVSVWLLYRPKRWLGSRQLLDIVAADFLSECVFDTIISVLMGERICRLSGATTGFTWTCKCDSSSAH